MVGDKHTEGRAIRPHPPFEHSCAKVFCCSIDRNAIIGQVISDDVRILGRRKRNSRANGPDINTRRIGIVNGITNNCVACNSARDVHIIEERHSVLIARSKNISRHHTVLSTLLDEYSLISVLGYQIIVYPR